MKIAGKRLNAEASRRNLSGNNPVRFLISRPGNAAHLMTQVLGYQRLAAQSGDWRAAVSSCLGEVAYRLIDAERPTFRGAEKPEALAASAQAF